MRICRQLAIARQRFQRLAFPYRVVVVDVAQNARFQYEETTIDPGAIPLGLLGEAGDAAAFDVKCAEAAWRLHRAHGRQGGAFAMEGELRGDIDVRQTVAVGKAERIVVEEFSRSLETATRLRVFAGIDKGHAPRFRVLVVHLHFITGEVESNVRGMQEVVGEVLLHHVALVAQADHEVVDAKMRIELEDVPQHRLAADFDHRFGAERGFLAYSGAEAAG